MIKVGIAFALGLEVFICTLLPYYYSSLKSSQKIFRIFDMLSAGLFMGTAFLHIIPEANQKLQQWTNEGVSLIHSHQQDHHHHHHHHHHHSLPLGSLISIVAFILILSLQVYFHDGHCGDNHSHNPRSHKRMQQILSSDTLKMRRRLMFETLLTQIALSVHCFFECMSIAISFGFAIFCHKWAQGFTLGMSYVTSGMEKYQAIKYAMFHSLLNFSAVIIGIQLSESNNLVEGIANGISGGTFLYVSMIEKINKNLKNRQQLGKQTILLLMGLGFSIIILH